MSIFPFALGISMVNPSKNLEGFLEILEAFWITPQLFSFYN